MSDVCGQGGFNLNFVMLNMDLYNFVYFSVHKLFILLYSFGIMSLKDLCLMFLCFGILILNG